jgi:hypothetical protein
VQHAQLPETTREGDSGPPPWDIDALEGDQLRCAYNDLAEFVDWLRACDITVPSCWYTHGWVVRRLAALQHWHDDAHTPEARARDAADWWLMGVMPVCRDWSDLVAHRGRHVSPESPLDDPRPVPALDDVVAELLAESGA